MGKPGPKPKGLDAAAEQRIVDLTAQGLGASAIAKILGVHERTVSRRQAALRGSLRPRPGSPTPVATPAPASASEGNVEAETDDGEEELPERSLTDAELEQAALGGTEPLDELIRSIAAEYRKATSGPLKQRIAGDYLKALDLRRKMTPPAPVDPNDQPDMVKLGAQVAERLHKMIDLVAAEVDGRQG